MAELTGETALPAQHGAVPSSDAWSIAAIASAACGIFLIVPYLSALAAIALGILGLRQTAGRLMRGRRLAWAGLALGAVNIVGWSLYFSIVADLSAGGRSAANRFFGDLNSGSPQSANRDCIAVAPGRLEDAANDVKNWGGVKSVTVLFITSDSANGATAGSVRGELQTPSGKHLFQLRTSDWKVADFSLQ